MLELHVNGACLSMNKSTNYIIYIANIQKPFKAM